MAEIVTYGDLCYAVAETLAPSITDLRVQPYDLITESIPDLPLLQVYMDNAVVDDVGSNDRATFDAGMRRTHALIFADGYARVRSHLGEDLRAQMELIDALDAMLVRQTAEPFGLSTIQAFHWKWSRATFKVGAEPSAIEYAGCRFQIDIWVW